ncbi:MAG: pseudouridine-5'-phosphate glycosidase, partial [bacterium]|nr:pseudouridine-5'-phosphate glycosidase [bacterium]
MRTRPRIHGEVEQALAAGRPVVALESTIIAHGMPYPENVASARRVEAVVREHGAVPATIAILAGEIRVGLDDDSLERLGGGAGVRKVSRRDLAVAVARGLDGATTVAATMIAAALAGIEVFVTGGIGGVHRGAAESFDVSADLQELARTSVAVVCAGAKAILDLGLTLEYLETHGVPVIGLRTDRFPAFYTRDSGHGVDWRVESEAELAEILKAKWDLGLAGGLVVANPIPRRHELEQDLVDRALDEALAQAADAGVTGKDVTPFLLSKMESLTGGASLEANKALIVDNARAGA